MSAVFSDAVVKYLGYGSASFPQANGQTLDPLVEHKLDQILAFTENLRPDWTTLDLVGAADWAKISIEAEFPYLNQDALDALVRACTFGWK